MSLLRISRDRDGGLELGGRSWQKDGSLSARYWSEAAKERKEPSGVFYYWKGQRGPPYAVHAQAVDRLEAAGVERVIFSLPPQGRDQILPLLDRYAKLIP